MWEQHLGLYNKELSQLKGSGGGKIAVFNLLLTQGGHFIDRQGNKLNEQDALSVVKKDIKCLKEKRRRRKVKALTVPRVHPLAQKEGTAASHQADEVAEEGEDHHVDRDDGNGVENHFGDSFGDNSFALPTSDRGHMQPAVISRPKRNQVQPKWLPHEVTLLQLWSLPQTKN